MSVWNELIDKSKKLEEAVRKIQRMNTPADDTPKSNNPSQMEIDHIISSYDSWYGTCLSLLPDDLKQNFRFFYEGDGYAAPCITKFFQAPLARKKTYPNGRRGKPVYTWQYPFQRYFSNPLQSQRQILIEVSLREPKEIQPQHLIQQAQTNTQKNPLKGGSEVLNKTQPQNVPQRLTRMHWVQIGIFFLALGAILDILGLIFSLSILVTVIGTISNFFGVAFALLQWLSPFPPLTEESNAGGTNRTEEPLYKHLWRNRKIRIGIFIVLVLFVIGPLIYAFLPHLVPIPNTS